MLSSAVSCSRLRQLFCATQFFRNCRMKGIFKRAVRKLLRMLCIRLKRLLFFRQFQKSPTFPERSYIVLLDQDNDQIQQRKRHLAEIADLGYRTYPTRFDRTHTISEVVERYHSLAGKKENEAEAAQVNQDLKAAEGGELRLAGRIMTMRLMGKAAFAHLSDGLNQLQVYFRKNDIGDDAWTLYQKLDHGDWIGVTG